jgi:hypothetical protein
LSVNARLTQVSSGEHKKARDEDPTAEDEAANLAARGISPRSLLMTHAPSHPATRPCEDEEGAGASGGTAAGAPLETIDEEMADAQASMRCGQDAGPEEPGTFQLPLKTPEERAAFSASLRERSFAFVRFSQVRMGGVAPPLQVLSQSRGHTDFGGPGLFFAPEMTDLYRTPSTST